MTNKIIGKYGEDLAQNFLIKKGYKILDRNFHYSKRAEIDIIAKKGDIIHFVEVKTRRQDFYGSPLEAITPMKLKQIFLCAQYYLKQTNEKYKKIQIDAIGIILDKEPKFSFVEDISI